MPLESIPLSSLTKIGNGLERPEDVVVGRDGMVWASDKASACAEIRPDGTLRRVGRAGGDPNGINMDRDGRIILANFGNGLVQRLDTDTGRIDVLCDSVGGRRLTASNYPILDSDGTIWCANSTFAAPWQHALDGRADGFLFRIRPDGSVEKMAEGIRFANGLALDRDEEHIYVCETTGCDVLRYRIHTDGTLGKPERYGPVLGEAPTAPFDPSQLPGREALNRLGYTDGCGFDVEGNLWVTLVAANRVVAIRPDGAVETVIDDPEGVIMNQPTNVSWGGPDMHNLYIGTIAGDYVLAARSSVAGMTLVHQR
jgi:gluconolactonase